MSHVQGAGLPREPSLRRQWRTVVCPQVGRPVEVLLLADTITGVWVHFDTKLERNRPCTLKPDCPYDLAKIPRRWAGYVPALHYPTRELCVAHITEGAARQLVQLAQESGGLRGRILTLRRTGKGKTSSVHPSLRTAPAEEFVPDPFDVMPSLEHVWSGDGQAGIRRMIDRLAEQWTEGAQLPAQLPGGEYDDPS